MIYLVDILDFLFLTITAIMIIIRISPSTPPKIYQTYSGRTVASTTSISIIRRPLPYIVPMNP